MFPVPLIPDDWSPQQALAVYEFLDALRDRLWDRYQEQIIEQFRADCEDQAHDEDQLELPFFTFNDEIPF